MSHSQLEEHDGAAAAASSQPPWVQEYNAALAKRDYKPPAVPGPHCCAICCTFFGTIGALFLFLISGMLKSRYTYVHIHGDPHRHEASMDAMASSTAWAGFVYLLIALVSICYWIQGNTLKQEYEDAEREESALLGASSEKEEGQ